MSGALSTHPKGAQFRFGVVAEVDAARARVKVRLPEQADLLTTWLPVVSPLAYQDRVLALPRVGAQVALLTDAYCEDGVCLGSIYSSPDPVPAGTDGQQFGVWYEDGTVVRYDQAQGELLADLSAPQGTARVTSQQVEAKAAEGMTLESRQMSASAGEGMTLSAGQGLGLSAATIDLSAASRLTLSAPALSVSGGGTDLTLAGGGLALAALELALAARDLALSADAGLTLAALELAVAATTVAITAAQAVDLAAPVIRLAATSEVTLTAPSIRLSGLTVINAAGDIDI